MAGGRNRLTATAVEKRKERGRLADGSGLWLTVSLTDSKSWVFRWTPNAGKPGEMGIGSHPTSSHSKVCEKVEVCHGGAGNLFFRTDSRKLGKARNYGDSLLYSITFALRPRLPGRSARPVRFSSAFSHAASPTGLPTVSARRNDP